MATNVLILGASVRAAAQSARDAGFSPSGIDFYADRDLRRLGPSIRLDQDFSPADIERMARSLPTGPFLYTGPLENRPDLIDQLVRDRPLWGQPGDVLKEVRDPERLARGLASSGFCYPDIAQTVPVDTGPWLLKPYASGGGLGIEHWDARQNDSIADGFYLQRLVVGTPLSAIFLGDGNRTRLVGLTRQILSNGPNPFLYLGSVGPWQVSPVVRTEILRLGGFLATNFHLRGIFGVDLIQDEESFAVIEVNPRYTSSVEILEWTTGSSLLVEHARCFKPNPSVGNPRVRPAVSFAAKRTILASRDWVMPATDLPLIPDSGPLPGCWLSDLPEPGEPFEAGQPVLTVNVTGRTAIEVLDALDDQLAGWTRSLGLGPDEAFC
ncbi:ATP-grasp domain-containing protein [Isosphaeraceae bacterium EP7]